MVARWIRGTLVLAAAAVIGVASTPARAGIIPAVYDAIFGPPGSIVAGTRGYTGYRGFGGDCCGVAAPMFGGGNCCGVGAGHVVGYYGAGFGGGNACGVSTSYYGPVLSSADYCGMPGSACGVATTAAMTGTPTPAPQPNTADANTGNTGAGSSNANPSANDDNSTFRNRSNRNSNTQTDESLRGGSGARGNFRPKTDSTDPDGFVAPVVGENSDANGAATDPTATPAGDAGKTKPAGDSKKGARPADKDDSAFGGEGAGLEAQPLNLEGPVASRPSLPRRRMTMKAVLGKAELVRRAAYPNSQWTSTEETRVATARK